MKFHQIIQHKIYPIKIFKLQKYFYDHAKVLNNLFKEKNNLIKHLHLHKVNKKYFHYYFKIIQNF